MFCYCCILFFFFKQKTAYEMRISDWSSDVCSSDLECRFPACWRTPALTARRRRLRNTKCRCGRTERPILLAWPARSQRPESEAHRCQTSRAVDHRSSAGADHADQHCDCHGSIVFSHRPYLQVANLHDRKSVVLGKRVSVRVYLVCRRIIQNKTISKT